MCFRYMSHSPGSPHTIRLHTGSANTVRYYNKPSHSYIHCIRAVYTLRYRLHYHDSNSHCSDSYHNSYHRNIDTDIARRYRSSGSRRDSPRMSRSDRSSPSLRISRTVYRSNTAFHPGRSGRSHCRPLRTEYSCCRYNDTLQNNGCSPYMLRSYIPPNCSQPSGCC